MNYNEIAKSIIENVGGISNVKSVTHCFTRLRFILKDKSKANKKVIEHLEGVISVVVSGGQFQIVLGGKVTKIYDILVDTYNLEEDNSATEEEKENIWNRILIAVSNMFTPMVPAIAASGLLKGFLTIAKIYVAKHGGDITGNQTYIILLAATDAIFYFMPLILAYSSAKVFKANEYVAMALGGTMCYPAIVSLMTAKDTGAVSMFGIQLTKANYVSSVIPIVIGVYILSYVQKFLEKKIPEVLKIILVPGLSLLIMVPSTFIVFGPIGIYLGNGINFLYSGMMNISPILCGAFVGGMWCVFVIFGAHRALLPIGINDVAQFGHQNLLAFAGAANFSQGGAALGVMLKTKDKNLKTVSASAMISAAVCGITEPAIYGCNLRLKKPMIVAIICGAIGGAIMGAGGVYGDAFANNGLLTLATYAAFGMKKFIFYLVGIGVSFFGAAILTYLIGFEDVINVEKEKKNINFERGSITISSPIEGSTIALSKVNDEVFSSEALGKGVAIIPKKGEVVAPEDCQISVIYPTMHALVLKLKNETELIIHVGIDTVRLDGKYFKSHVNEGDFIKKGEKIISFDMEKIENAGFDLTTSIVVNNTENYRDIQYKELANASINTEILGILV